MISDMEEGITFFCVIHADFRTKTETRALLRLLTYRSSKVCTGNELCLLFVCNRTLESRADFDIQISVVTFC